MSAAERLVLLERRRPLVERPPLPGADRCMMARSRCCNALISAAAKTISGVGAHLAFSAASFFSAAWRSMTYAFSSVASCGSSCLWAQPSDP